MPNYFAFLLTRERVKASGSTGTLKLTTVKMRWAPTEESKAEDLSFDNDEETKASTTGKTSKDTAGSISKWRLKFDYVTSLRPKIENFRGDKQKPNYLNVVMASEPKHDDSVDELMDDAIQEVDKGNGSAKEPALFYLYTGVGSQSVVFKRGYSDLAS